METRTAWMLPSELQVVQPTAEEEQQPRPRSSPRRTHAPSSDEQRSDQALEFAPAAASLPARAAHERKRKLPQLPEANVRGRQKAERQTTTSKITAAERVRQFENHSLAVRAGEIFCQACKTVIFNKWSTINTHCKLVNGSGQETRHAMNLKRWETRADDDADLKETLASYYREHPSEAGGTTDPDELAFRYRTTETFLASGTPLAKADIFRPLLQRSGHSLTSAVHLQRFIPKIEEAENLKLRAELKGQYISVSFDGTTRLGEAVNTTARWCSDSFELEQRLIDFTTFEKHLAGDEFAVHETDVILTQLCVRSTSVVNFTRDSCSTNGVACRTLIQHPFRNASDIMCISHTLNNTGSRLLLPTLDKFKSPWLQLAGGRQPHTGAKKLWKQMVSPQSVPGYSTVRWWSWASITFVIAEAGMQRLGDFIQECETRGYGDASTKSLRSIYDNELDSLRLELAAMIDCKRLVTTTHDLEGDRLEIMVAFERVETLRAMGRHIRDHDDGCLPNVDATLRRLMVLKPGVAFEKYFDGHGIASGKLVKQEVVDSTLYPGQQRKAWLVKYDSDGMTEHFEEEELRSGKDGPAPTGADGKPVLLVRHLQERKDICAAIWPAFEYLENRITGNCESPYDCTTMYSIFRVIRAFDPNFAHAHVDTAFVDSMSVVRPLLAQNLLADMKRDLPAYLAAAAQAPIFNKSDLDSYTTSLLIWWRVNGKTFPGWAIAARIAFALTPNSASCERVFSLLEEMFGPQQDGSLADQLRAAIMLAYNKRRVG